MLTIQNQEFAVTIDETGAEMRSIKDLHTEREYLWQGNKEYWDGQSPLLFPNVGNLWNKTYRHNGKEYQCPKHGFARTIKFDVETQTPSSVTLLLCENQETLQMYPFKFELRVNYALEGRTLSVRWHITNRTSETMYFQIGGHPSFNYRDYHDEDTLHGYLSFEPKQTLSTRLIGDKGCASTEFAPVPLDEEMMLPITNTTFDLDTFVLQDHQVTAVTLHDKARQPYVTVHAHTPVMCLWSPKDGQAPFVCIEPWAGLCDTVGFEGSLPERNDIQQVAPETGCQIGYTVDFL